MKRHVIVLLTASSLVAISAFGAGCSSDESLAGGDAATSAESATAPSFSDLDNALNLDSGDETIVKAALADWGRGEARNRPGLRARQSEMKFVAAVSPSLDDEQLTNMVDLFLARREARQAEMHERRGDGKRFEKLASRLGLTDAQKAGLKTLHEETRAQAKSERDAFKQGAISEDQLHARLRNIHTAAREKTEALLTPEQIEKFDSMREDRIDRRREHRAGHAERTANRAAWLDAALQLSDEQASKVESALTTMAETRTSIHTSRESKAITREQAREQIRAARETLEATLKSILTTEQQTRLEILEPLIPGRRHHA